MLSTLYETTAWGVWSDAVQDKVLNTHKADEIWVLFFVHSEAFDRFIL